MPLLLPRCVPVACAIGCADASIPPSAASTDQPRRDVSRGRPNHADHSRTLVDPPRATLLATPVDLRGRRNAGEAEVASAFYPAYADALRRLPAGRQVFRGLPFRLARASSRRRWVLLDRPVTVDLRSYGRVSHVVIAHFCDAWRDPEDGRPADLPIGWV